MGHLSGSGGVNHEGGTYPCCVKEEGAKEEKT